MEKYSLTRTHLPKRYIRKQRQQQISIHPIIHIVLTTYNGKIHIAEQLDSLLAQSVSCHIHICDDNSTDGTIELIQRDYLHHENLSLTVNPIQLGYVKNFEYGIQKAYNLGAQYIALCDQDDIWATKKIERLISTINLKDTDTPTLVYSDLKMIDANGNNIHKSYIAYRNYADRSKHSQNSLAICLGQNGVMGNTILMNRALISQTLPFPDDLHYHDYWVSLIAQLYGKCAFIPEPLVNYRIHSNNTSNSTNLLNKPASSIFQKIWKIISHRNYRLPYKEDSRAQVLSELTQKKTHNYYPPLNPKDRALITGFIHYLNFDKPRYYLAYWMLKHQFIKKGFVHRVYFVYKLLITTRYTRR